MKQYINILTILENIPMASYVIIYEELFSGENAPPPEIKSIRVPFELVSSYITSDERWELNLLFKIQDKVYESFKQFIPGKQTSD